MSDETLRSLNDTLNRYTASALSTVPIPEFRGLPGEDVHDFLQRFKLATLTFSDELRCLALNKALVKAARTWAKSNIKGAIQTGDWKAAKKAIVNRFAAPDQDLRFHEKLAKMHYNPAEGTLLSHVEEYTSLYRKVNEQASDAEVIKNLSLNLPSNIIRHLNILSESWSALEDLSSLYALVRRLETKILPFELEQSGEEKTTVAEIAKLLKEMRDTIRPKSQDLEMSRPVESAKETIAAVAHSNGFQPSRPSNNQKQDIQRGYQPYNYERRGRQYFDSRDKNHYKFQRQERLLKPFGGSHQKDNSIPTSNTQPAREELQAAYLEQHGKPPGPCQICGDDHFNRHCPFKDLK